MNRITIGKRVYDLGKVTSRHLTMDEWEEAKKHLRRSDKAHVVKIESEFFYVIGAKHDPKYNRVDLQYRNMTFVFVEPDDRTVEAPDQMSIRSLRKVREL